MTTIMTTTSTALDRYMGLSDLAVHDEAALDEALALFAADATVEIGPEPAHGSEAIPAFYRARFAAHAEMKHFWNTAVLDDGTLRAEWVRGTQDGRQPHHRRRGGIRHGRRSGAHQPPSQRVHPPPRLSRPGRHGSGPAGGAVRGLPGQ
ncbi:nuclear transport factor 2 family protein [Streptomyces sp. NBC_00457]|uniref:nuclear transport factor 2 family protein n=1 Tax=unclassified Streptomyces TaxID=2593676 RepID=UPI002E1A8288|nr:MULTISPECIES: nuclear transport factor 2 family protein [unclassified Streptomyces]